MIRLRCERTQYGYTWKEPPQSSCLNNLQNKMNKAYAFWSEKITTSFFGYSNISTSETKQRQYIKNFFNCKSYKCIHVYITETEQSLDLSTSFTFIYSLQIYKNCNKYFLITNFTLDKILYLSFGTFYIKFAAKQPSFLV